MKKTTAVIFFISFIIGASYSLSFSVPRDRSGANAEKKYTDVGKKIINIGNAYYHRIEKGDTIWGTLIKENKVDPNYYEYYLKELLRLNPQIKDPDLIYAGKKMLVPVIPEEHQKEWTPPKESKPKKKAAKPEPLPKKVAKKAEVEVAPLVTGKRLQKKTIDIKPPSPQKQAKKKAPAKAPQKVSDKLKFSILTEFPPEKKKEKKPEAPKKVTKKKEKPEPKDAKKKSTPVLKKKDLEKKVAKKAKPEEPKKAEKPKPAEKPKAIKEAKKPEPKKPKEKAKAEERKPKTKADLALSPSKTGTADTKGVAVSGGAAGTVVMGNALISALKTFTDKIVTKGSLYFPLKNKKPLKLDNAVTPVVYNREKKIVLDYGDKVKKDDEDYIKSKFEYYDFVNVKKSDSDKVIMGKVLKASGYHSVREDREIKVGKNIKLVINYDWLIEKDSNSFLNGDVKLVNAKVTDDKKVPRYVKEYLERMGFFVSEVKVSKKDKSKKRKKRQGTLTSLNDVKSAKDIVKKILDLAGVEHKYRASLQFHVEDKLSIYADFYFEIGDDAYVINLKPTPKEKKEYLQKYDVKVLELDPKQGYSENVKKVLNLLQKDYRYGTYRLLGDKGEKPFLDVEVKGFLIGKKARGIKSGKNIYYETLPLDSKSIFVTRYKFPSTIKRLVTDHGYKVIEK